MRSQSNLIVSAVALSFFVWIVLRGTFRQYLNDLGIGRTPPSTTLNNAVGGGLGGPAIPPGLFGPGGLNLPSLPPLPGGLPGGTPPFNPNAGT